MTKLLSDRVKKIPPNKVSADRYSFLRLAEAEPDLGTPSGNNYILSSLSDGTRNWIDPTTSLSAPGANGQIIFNDNGFLEGANSLIYDSVNDRVGIGIAPVSKLDVAGDIRINSNIVINSEAITVATTAQTQIASFSADLFRSGKLIIQAYDTITGAAQVSELLIIHDTIAAYATEYGVIHTGSDSLVVYDVDITDSNVRLLATRMTSNSTQYKISETLMVL
jgi:hypothetical protein